MLARKKEKYISSETWDVQFIGKTQVYSWLAPADYFLPKGSSFRKVERFEREVSATG
jgi:hypothetical protein